MSEEGLEPKEVKIESLTKDELVRLCNDKDLELQNYNSVVENLQKEKTSILQNYNSDMEYISTVNSNLIKVMRRKEDAIKQIISGALMLMTIDREEIAPERKEDI